MPRVSSWKRWWLISLLQGLRIRRYVPMLLKSCPEPFRGEVLEVGAGSGWSSRRILETFPQVELTAVDVDQAAGRGFARWRSRYGQRLRFQQADVLALPFGRASFDVVLALSVLHTIDDQRQAVRQFLRVLRPGGLIGVSEVKPRRGSLAEILQNEGAEIVAQGGRRRYYLWARKPYPY